MSVLSKHKESVWWRLAVSLRLVIVCEDRTTFPYACNSATQEAKQEDLNFQAKRETLSQKSNKKKNPNNPKKPKQS